MTTTKIIQDSRIQALNDKPIQAGEYVLYWMQRAQRAEDNHALEYAIQQANDRQQPLLVVFGLMDNYPEANLRHYTFMLEGLAETQRSLARRGIKLVIQPGQPAEVALRFSERASLLVCDRAYLRHTRAWRRQVADEVPCRLVQVETDVVVPVELVSGKAEYAARTIRPKIHRHLEEYLVELRTTPLEHASLELAVDDGLDLSDRDALLARLDIDRSVGPVSHLFQGGTSQAKQTFRRFLDEKLSRYDNNRNQPQTDDVSHMSKHLHFGQVSPLYLVLQIRESDTDAPEAVDSFIEEVVVRRELAINFVYYNSDYDLLDCLPGWAQETLEAHKGDVREPHYSRQTLEQANTHDPYWNAAMKEMIHTGYMHNYMRMYWGKKILEWSATPEEAHQTLLYLNNKYFLDGRDPNSYAGAAWIFGLHDRAWQERPVYGKVRYMSAGGLERKCDIEGYVEKVEEFSQR